MKRTIVIWLLMFGTTALIGCSSKQLYEFNRDIAKKRCFRVTDIRDRDRCLNNEAVSYEQYQQDVDAAPQPK